MGNNGTCLCAHPYFGVSCEFTQCPKSTDGVVCNGEGTCDVQTGKCRCVEGYFGSACDKLKCPMYDGQECGGHSRGVCDRTNGWCTCASGLYHYDCSLGQLTATALS